MTVVIALWLVEEVDINFPVSLAHASSLATLSEIFQKPLKPDTSRWQAKAVSQQHIIRERDGLVLLNNWFDIFANIIIFPLAEISSVLTRFRVCCHESSRVIDVLGFHLCMSLISKRFVGIVEIGFGLDCSLPSSHPCVPVRVDLNLVTFESGAYQGTVRLGPVSFLLHTPF